MVFWRWLTRLPLLSSCFPMSLQRDCLMFVREPNEHSWKTKMNQIQSKLRTASSGRSLFWKKWRRWSSWRSIEPWRGDTLIMQIEIHWIRRLLRTAWWICREMENVGPTCASPLMITHVKDSDSATNSPHLTQKLDIYGEYIHTTMLGCKGIRRVSAHFKWGHNMKMRKNLRVSEFNTVDFTNQLNTIDLPGVEALAPK